MTERKPTAERRREIADAALRVIARQGLGRFTTQAIAEEVGITDGSLFRHFASKDEIVAAALDRVEERLFSATPPDDPDPVVRLEKFFRFRASLLAESPVIARLAFSDELPHAAGERGARQVESWKRRSIGFVAGCAAEAMGRGQLRPDLAPREVGIVVLGTLMALVRLSDIGGGEATIDRAWTVISSLFTGLEPPSSQWSPPCATS